MLSNVVRYGAMAAAVSLLALPALAAGDLTKVKVSGFHEAYATSGALPTSFKSIYVAPVGANVDSASLKDLGPRDIKTMEDYLGGALKDQLGKRFTLASAPGPGTLVIEATFTDLQSNRMTGDQAAKRPDLDTIRTVRTGRAAIAIVVRDGSSQATLATFADSEDGWPIMRNPETSTIWGTAQRISRQWAQDLTDVLTGR